MSMRMRFRPPCIRKAVFSLIVALAFFAPLPAKADIAAGDGAQGAPAADALPNLLVSQYELSKPSPKPGDALTLSVDVFNASKLAVVKDLVLSFSTDDFSVYPAAGKSNKILVGDLTAMESVTVPIECVLSPDAPQVIHLRLIFDYADAGYKYHTSESVIGFETALPPIPLPESDDETPYAAPNLAADMGVLPVATPDPEGLARLIEPEIFALAAYILVALMIAAIIVLLIRRHTRR